MKTKHRLQAARAVVNRAPTDGQKSAGNYRKGHVGLHGLRIAVENPRGSVRRGKNANGTAWARRMPCDYGYIKGTEGKDGDAVDVYIGPHPEAEFVLVIDQVNPATGRFDEHKVVLGCRNEKEARRLYLRCYPAGWKGIGAAKPLTMGQFKQWLDAGSQKVPANNQMIMMSMKTRYFQTMTDREREQLRKDRRTLAIGAGVAGVTGAAALAYALKHGKRMKMASTRGLPMNSEAAVDAAKRTGERVVGATKRKLGEIKKGGSGRPIRRPERTRVDMGAQTLPVDARAWPKIPEVRRKSVERLERAAQGGLTGAESEVAADMVKRRLKKGGKPPVVRLKDYRPTLQPGQAAMQDFDMKAKGMNYFQRKKQERDGLATARDVALTGAGVAGIGAAGYAGYKGGKAAKSAVNDLAARGRAKIRETGRGLAKVPGEVNRVVGNIDHVVKTKLTPAVEAFRDTATNTREATRIGADLGRTWGAVRNPLVSAYQKGAMDTSKAPAKSVAESLGRKVGKFLGKRLYHVKGMKLAAKAGKVHYFRRQQWREQESNRFVDGLSPVAGLVKAYTPGPNGSKIEVPAGVLHGQTIRSAINTGREVNKWGGRVGNLAKDSVDVVRGKPRGKDASGRTKKREWEKSWFKNAAGAAVTGAALAGGAVYVGKRPHLQAPIKKTWGKVKNTVNSYAPDFFPEFDMATGEVVYFGAEVARYAKQQARAAVRAKAAKRAATVRALKKSAMLAGAGTLAGAGAMKLHADQPEATKKVTGQRVRNTLIGGAAGAYLGGMLHAGKSGYKGARIGAALGAGLGAVTNPKRKTALDELPTASFEAAMHDNDDLGRTLKYRGILGRGRPDMKVKKKRGLVMDRIDELGRKRGKVHEFDAVAAYEGWDIRDPRGRSARVFAPGSRKRVRREKEWYERKENQQKLWAAGAVAAGLAGAGAGLYVGRKMGAKSGGMKPPVKPSRQIHGAMPATGTDGITDLNKWRNLHGLSAREILTEFAMAKFRLPKSYDMKWKASAATVNPRVFLSKAHVIHNPKNRVVDYSPKKTVDMYRAKIRAGEKIEMPLLSVERKKNGGFKVVGHEGRHRMMAAQAEGIKKVPVAIHAPGEERFPKRAKEVHASLKDIRAFEPEKSYGDRRRFAAEAKRQARERTRLAKIQAEVEAWKASRSQTPQATYEDIKI